MQIKSLPKLGQLFCFFNSRWLCPIILILLWLDYISNSSPKVKNLNASSKDDM